MPPSAIADAVELGGCELRGVPINELERVCDALNDDVLNVELVDRDAVGLGEPVTLPPALEVELGDTDLVDVPFNTLLRVADALNDDDVLNVELADRDAVGLGEPVTLPPIDADAVKLGDTELVNVPFITLLRVADALNDDVLSVELTDRDAVGLGEPVALPPNAADAVELGDTDLVKVPLKTLLRVADALVDDVLNDELAKNVAV